MKTYQIRTLDDLALHFLQCAERLETSAGLGDAAISRADAALNVAQANGFRCAANIVKDTQYAVEWPLIEEYSDAYAAAREQFCNTFWVLMKVAGVGGAVYGVDHGWANP